MLRVCNNMGYGHSYMRPRTIEDEKYHAIMIDFRKLHQNLRDEIPLGDGNGEGEPILTDEIINFNGLNKCGHIDSASGFLAYPVKGANGWQNVGQPFQKSFFENSWIGGPKVTTRVCSGNCSYENMYFPKASEPLSFNEGETLRRTLKTNFQPYDVMVTAFLLLCKYHLGDDFHVASDGGKPQWLDACMVLKRFLGYGGLEDMIPDRQGDWF